MTCRQGRAIQPRFAPVSVVRPIRRLSRAQRFWNSRFGVLAFTGGYLFSGLVLAAAISAAIALLGDPRPQ